MKVFLVLAINSGTHSLNHVKVDGDARNIESTLKFQPMLLETQKIAWYTSKIQNLQQQWTHKKIRFCTVDSNFNLDNWPMKTPCMEMNGQHIKG